MGEGQDFLRLPGIRHKSLFNQTRLAGKQCLPRHVGVVGVGRAYIDKVDVRVSYQLAVRAVGIFDVPAVEKTGAGDTFCACVLNYILEHSIDNLSLENLHEMLTFANAAAALIVQRKGALKAMPSKAEILQLLQRYV